MAAANTSRVEHICAVTDYYRAIQKSDKCSARKSCSPSKVVWDFSVCRGLGINKGIYLNR